MKEKTCLVIQHVAFEDLGTFHQPITHAGYTVRYLQAGVDDLSEIGAADLVIVLGGPIGVYETAAYPFLTDEIVLIGRRVAADRPTLGICLGAQMIAAAAGGRVYPGTAGKEIGWAPIQLTEAGAAGALKPLVHGDDVVLHWHGDTVDLPSGATRLASTSRYTNQAFSLGDNVLALQFHPEADSRTFERWLIGHTVEIAGTDGVDPAGLRRDATRYGESLEERGGRFIRSWLQQLDASV
ncbi:MAG: glutamine amidotransferase [Spirochaeta sp.]|jgi:GMP synthase (glutamine-hydrolysing)|nr:glutamine amidotransferase [Spirochaeta sp.]